MCVRQSCISCRQWRQVGKRRPPWGNDTCIPVQKVAAEQTKEIKHSFSSRSFAPAAEKRAMAAPARRPLRGPAVARAAPLSDSVGEPEAPVFFEPSLVLVTPSVLVGAAVVEEPRPVEVGTAPVDCETVGREKAMTRVVEARMLRVVWRMIGDRRDWLQVKLQAINR
ncbi:hypothetical protein P168DRAFT_28345 [Aspergillus campestris IBT 28561]|uniref:Uncharacterized protein n=1 Tax=Aspergillus campestris (strain IBT 28561) TaxID=1392248 RepID=A0A2I1DGK8_ASPC2|nr:uncharacterized protein P168DRAFT_28345 [Aspergillus campestris IBT 28561]PKY09004.1 hypothetical protein P168DRAFT_28345 [Aspergillus campestris IBT 28561]